MAAIVGAVVAAGIGIYSIVKSNQAKKKAEAEAKKNKRPVLSINDEDWANQAIAKSLAGQGLTDNAKQTAMQGYDRGLTASIDAILKGGGDVNAVGDVYDRYLTNVDRLAMADDQARINNITRLMASNQAISAKRDNLFQVNEYAPFVDKQKALAQQLGQANQDNAQGLALTAQGVAMAGSAYQRNKDISNLNKASQSVNNIDGPYSPSYNGPYQGKTYNSFTNTWSDSYDYSSLTNEQKQQLLFLTR